MRTISPSNSPNQPLRLKVLSVTPPLFLGPERARFGTDVTTPNLAAPFVSARESDSSHFTFHFPFCSSAISAEAMAVPFSSTVNTVTVSSASSFKARIYRNPCLLNYQSRFNFNPLCPRPFLARKLFRVQATVLQDDQEKVAVEDSFQPKTIPADDGREIDPESSRRSSSSRLERWVIKFEQSINILLTESVIKILDTLYHDRHYARFFVLETIARVPYFAFISVLHMYESFGWWRRADYLKVHFAESWNEMHHLLIMEELGGNTWWFDRFLAQHIAIFYYFMTVFMYALSPRMAYHFSECVESHAYATYDKFIKTQGEELKKLPAPEVAVKYYTGGDLYLFDEFQTARAPNSRRPKIENLYDVFLNIRDDEGEHCKTMKACQTHGNLRSPHSYPEDTLEGESGCVLPQTEDCEGIVDCIRKSLSSQAKGM